MHVLLKKKNLIWHINDIVSQPGEWKSFGQRKQAKDEARKKNKIQVIQEINHGEEFKLKRMRSC